MAHGYQDRYDCLYVKMSSYRIDFLFGVFGANKNEVLDK